MKEAAKRLIEQTIFLRDLCLIRKDLTGDEERLVNITIKDMEREIFRGKGKHADNSHS